MVNFDWMYRIICFHKKSYRCVFLLHRFGGLIEEKSVVLQQESAKGE